MSNIQSPSISSRSGELPETLNDRVVARVSKARLVIEQRATAARSRASRRRQAHGAQAPDSKSEGEVREVESLKRVFRDLGISYRRYRSQSGDPVIPGLRDAAYGFRAEPSLASLLAVAAYLDQLDLLS